MNSNRASEKNENENLVLLGRRSTEGVGYSGRGRITVITSSSLGRSVHPGWVGRRKKVRKSYVS